MMNPTRLSHEELLPGLDTSDVEPLPFIDEGDFSISDIEFFPDEEEVSLASSSAEIPPPPPSEAVSSQNPHLPNISSISLNTGPFLLPSLLISTEPHISTQFYTFNKASHALMTQCLIEGRLATPEEIQAVNPPSVLATWRSVWSDRNEGTAYTTAWKRIQDKLTVREGDPAVTLIGNDTPFICFKNNLSLFVSHVDQWQDIVMAFHTDADLKHLGLRNTIDRIKQVWAVGSKFYGIPESYIRTCVAACPVCSDDSSGHGRKSKKRKFEYTESFDVPAKDVPMKLQQLAVEHKVTLSIRQKYIRYKPFMAEVKDYTCHRAGEPGPSKGTRAFKRESYVSKRCGCGFRIRAIVPISNYNEKDKTFAYKEEGTAVFKMYAVHSGHEPGPVDGNARVMHRTVGHKEEALVNQEILGGITKEGRMALVNQKTSDGVAEEGEMTLKNQETPDGMAEEGEMALAMVNQEIPDRVVEEGKMALENQETPDGITEEGEVDLVNQEISDGVAEEGKLALENLETPDGMTEEGEVDLVDQEILDGMAEEGGNNLLGLVVNDYDELRHSVLQQLKDLRNQAALLERQIAKLPPHNLAFLSHELFDMVYKLGSVSGESFVSVGLPSGKQHLDDVQVVEHDFPDQINEPPALMYGDGKDAGVVEDDEQSFRNNVGEIPTWVQIGTECRNEKDLLGETCQEDGWLNCEEFGEKSMLGCTKPPLGLDEALDLDLGLAGIHVDGFSPENPKWFDSPG